MFHSDSGKNSLIIPAFIMLFGLTLITANAQPSSNIASTLTYRTYTCDDVGDLNMTTYCQCKQPEFLYHL